MYEVRRGSFDPKDSPKHKILQKLSSIFFFSMGVGWGGVVGWGAGDRYTKTLSLFFVFQAKRKFFFSFFFWGRDASRDQNSLRRENSPPFFVFEAKRKISFSFFPWGGEHKTSVGLLLLCSSVWLSESCMNEELPLFLKNSSPLNPRVLKRQTFRQPEKLKTTVS